MPRRPHIATLVLVALLGCGDPPTEERPTTPAVAPACEPSGAVRAHDDPSVIWVADDEERALTRYGGEPLAPIATVALPHGDRPRDAEALALDPRGRLFVVGSHARRDGAFDDARARIRIVRPNGAELDDVGLIQSPDLAEPSACAAAITGEGAAGLCARLRNGLEIEGAFADADGLYLGLRAPLSPAGHAYVLRVVAEPGELRATIVATLDLGGRGVRGMSRAGDEVWVLAGPSEDGAARHAVFAMPGDVSRWVHAPPRRLADAPPGAETVVPPRGDHAALVFVDGGRCAHSGPRTYTP